MQTTHHIINSLCSSPNMSFGTMYNFTRTRFTYSRQTQSNNHYYYFIDDVYIWCLSQSVIMFKYRLRLYAVRVFCILLPLCAFWKQHFFQHSNKRYVIVSSFFYFAWIVIAMFIRWSHASVSSWMKLFSFDWNVRMCTTVVWCVDASPSHRHNRKIVRIFHFIYFRTHSKSL